MSVIARSVRGTLVAGLGFSVQVVIAILAVPLMLAGWDAGQYALWVACQAAFSLLLTFDMGHQTYVGNELTKLMPVSREQTREGFGSGLRFALALAAGEIAVVGVLAFSGQAHRLLGMSGADASKHALAYVLVILVVSWTVVGSVGGLFARLYPAAGQFSRAAWWSMAQKVSVTGSAIAAAWLGASLLATAVLVGVVTTVLGAAFLVDGRRTLGSLAPFAERGSLGDGFRAFLRSLPITASAFVLQLQGNGLVLIVSALLGPVALATLATLRSLANSVVQAVSALVSPVVPELVRLDVLAQADKLRAGLFAINVLTTLPAALGALLLSGLGELLYGLWTHDKVPFDARLFVLLVVAVLWRIFGLPLTNHLNAMNSPRWIGLWACVQTAVLFAVALPASPRLGLTGVGLGILCSELAGSVVVPLLWLRDRTPATARLLLYRQQIGAALSPAVASVALLASLAVPNELRGGCLIGGAAAVLLVLPWQWRRIAPELKAQLSSMLRRRLRATSTDAP